MNRPSGARRLAATGTVLLLLGPVGTVLSATPAQAAPAAPVVSNRTMANLPGNERELYVAVDPNDPRRTMAGSNVRGGSSGQQWFASADGGRTFTNGLLPYGTVDITPGTPSLMSDPAIDYGSDGTAYFSALAHDSTTGGPCTLFVSASTDQGGTWTDPGSGVVADGNNVCNDKQGVVVDRANGDNVDVAWTPFGGTNDRELVFSRDVGGRANGFAFSAPIVLSVLPAPDNCLNHGADLTIDNTGAIWVAWSSFCSGFSNGDDASVYVARSVDHGLTFGAPTLAASMDVVFPNISSGFRTRSFPSIEADPATGRVFVTYADNVSADGNSDGDIEIVSSTDGTTWSSPQRVNQDSGTTDQFMPWLSVGGGRVLVNYYSRADATGEINDHVAYAPVSGGALSFTERRVSSASTPDATGFLGDYTGSAYGSDNVFHTAWGDGRTGVGGSTDAWAGRIDFSPPSLVTAPSPAPAFAGTTNTLVATVTGASGELEQFIPVSFSATPSGTATPSAGSAPTGADGKASFTYSQAAAGTDTVHVWADLDENGTEESGEAVDVAVTWLARPTTTTYTGPSSGRYSDAVTVSGTLQDALSNGALAGQTLTFTIGADTCAGTTDAAGAASCSLTLSGIPGPSTVTTTFAGTSGYQASSDSDPFTVLKEITVATFTGPAFVATTGTSNLSATLTDDELTPIAGRSLTLTLGSGSSAQSCSGTTSASGLASCGLTVTQALGPQPVSVAFAGDAYYLPSGATGSVVVFAWTTGGNFTIADAAAAPASQVTFWGDDWYLRNVPSGGVAPSSFKGFANQPAGPTSCGGTWRGTNGGNSTGAPATVPSYTAVLVTSKVTKSGNTSTGTKPQIVIVRTNAGYSPSPGKTGTATVLGSLCG